MSARKPSHALADALDGVVARFFRRPPKQSRSHALVTAVLDAADELIRRGTPIEELTIERLSARAGIGMGTFYEYFASKDSVLGVLIGKLTRANFDELSRKLEALEADSLEELVHGFSVCASETYLAHPNRARILIEAIGRLALLELIHEEKDRFAIVMARRAAVFLPGAPEREVIATMRLLADVAFGVLGFAAMRGGPVDVAEVANELAALGTATIERRHPER